MNSSIRRLATSSALALALSAALLSTTVFAEGPRMSAAQPTATAGAPGMPGTQSGIMPFAMQQQAATSPMSRPAEGRMAAGTPHWVTSGAEVRKVQQALVEHGIGVRIDGLMGPETRAALKYYQSKNDLTVTGRIDLATLESLNVS